MICHVVHYLSGDESSWGVLQGGRVFALPEAYGSTREFLESGRGPAMALLKAIESGEHTGAGVELEHLTVLSPVTRDGKVLCLGANYRQHLLEVGMDPEAKNFNLFFNKSSASICGPSDDVLRPAHVRLLDYEVELGLVIHGELRKEKTITRETLHEHIAGIVVSNDISARDVQLPQGQFFKGKSYRTFCPVGPVLCLLEAEDMHYLESLELQLQVNGEIRQQDNTGNLVFKPAESLSELSQVSDLLAGDLVMTGTPHGCALKIQTGRWARARAQLLPENKRWSTFIDAQEKSARYLKPGDVITASISSVDGAVDLGRQHNCVNQD
jgi:2-keto-4-pentenoate hydratase/2-oxohepta-3-ene-1,7-dioic acid hydratase in catechol pathway